MRRDLLSAYAAAAARILSWVVVSALVYRRLGAGPFALLVFVRGTIGILNYAAVGLAPAMIRFLAEARVPRQVIPVHTDELVDYAQDREYLDPVTKVYVNGIAWSLVTCSVGLILLIGYVRVMGDTSVVTLAREGDAFMLVFGVGVLLRLMSDAASAVLQTSGRIVTDNMLVIGAELFWVLMAAATIGSNKSDFVQAVGGTFCFASALLLIVRWFAANSSLPKSDISRFKHLDPEILKRLLTFGLLITAAQLADYLYAPTDFVLISILLHPIENATYGPAVQIDAGLLLLVGGLAAVLLPKAALAHTAGDHARLKRYYFKGTFISAIFLLIAGLATWLLSPWIFRLWFANPMTATQAILPLILIHTIIGGSSAVGRSILLGMGKVKPFTIAVLVAGMSNVLLSYVFVLYFHLGLRGIVLGTIVAVFGRCAIWMPWYVTRTLRLATAD